MRAERVQLEQRLKWYSENQEFLDRDAQRLRQANTRIAELEAQLGAAMQVCFTQPA